MSRHTAFFSPLIALLALAGCAPDKAAPGSHFIVTVPRAQFYKYGPAQSFGADFVLPKGQRVIMLDRSFGFSRVMTDDGIAGWVASEELAPAPPLPVAAVTKGGKKRGGGGDGVERVYSGPRKGSHVEPVPGDPLFDMSDLPPPPLPENPEKKPEFRASPPKTN